MKRKRLRKENLWKIETKENLVKRGLSYTLISYYYNVYNATFSEAPVGMEKEYTSFIKRVSFVMDSLTKTDMINRVAKKELLTKYGYTSEDEIGRGHRYNRFITKRFYNALTVPVFKLQLLTDRNSDELVNPEEKAARRVEIYKVSEIGKRGMLLGVTQNENRWFKPVNIKNIKINDYIVFDRFELLDPVVICKNYKDALKVAKKMRDRLSKKLKSLNNLYSSASIEGKNRYYNNVTLKELKKTFNLNKVMFNNSINSDARQNIINNLYAALVDFTDVLNINKKNISFNKKLSFAIDRDIPKFDGICASAVCNPDKSTISLSRKSGAGNIAHEWAHLLDAKLFIYFKVKSGNGYLSCTNNIKDMPEFNKLMKAIKYRTNGKKTNFYKKSLKRDKSDLIRFNDNSYYWSDNAEMFARTFAIYIKDKLNKSSKILVRDRESNNIEFKFTAAEKKNVYKKMDSFLAQCKELKII